MAISPLSVSYRTAKQNVFSACEHVLTCAHCISHLCGTNLAGRRWQRSNMANVVKRQSIVEIEILNQLNLIECCDAIFRITGIRFNRIMNCKNYFDRVH